MSRGVGLLGLLVVAHAGACSCRKGTRAAPEAGHSVPIVQDAVADPELDPDALGADAESAPPDDESGEWSVDVSATDAGNDETAVGRVVEEGTVTVHRVVTCQKVERQRPVRPATIFRRGPRDSVSVYLEVEAVGADAKFVKVSLEPRDGSADTGRPVQLKITRARPYRTYATFRTTGRPPGLYEAVVRDPDERIVALAPVELLE